MNENKQFINMDKEILGLWLNGLLTIEVKGLHVMTLASIIQNLEDLIIGNFQKESNIQSIESKEA